MFIFVQHGVVCRIPCLTLRSGVVRVCGSRSDSSSSDSARMTNFLHWTRAWFVCQGRLRAGWRFGLLVVLYLGCGPLLDPLLSKLHFPDRRMTAGAMSLNEGLDLALIALFSWIVARLGRERVGEYGLAFRSGWERLFLSGVLWGAVPSVLILIPIWLAGACSFQGMALHGTELVGSAALWWLAFLLVGLAEEFTFRGCAQATLGEAIGFWPAAVLLSSTFGLVHLFFKQNEGWVDPISVALYGLFWCFTLKRTGNLWFAVGFHAASDYVDMVVFAEPNTGNGGMSVPGHLLNIAFHGPVWLTGGPRGTEASLLVFPVLAGLFSAFNLLYPGRASKEREARPVQVV